VAFGCGEGDDLLSAKWDHQHHDERGELVDYARLRGSSQVKPTIRRFDEASQAVPNAPWIHGMTTISPQHLASELDFKPIDATADGFKAEKQSACSSSARPRGFR
jgi:hypothetical protein